MFLLKVFKTFEIKNFNHGLTRVPKKLENKQHYHHYSKSSKGNNQCWVLCITKELMTFPFDKLK